jgi:hypothetical protein
MFMLDRKTIGRLARVICDLDGPYERASWQLEELLDSAGWLDPPPYDGSPRVLWLTECLLERLERHERSGDVERLICRVCDPLEYDDGMGTAEIFRDAVNDSLRPERLSVTFLAGRPVLADVTEDGTSTTYSAPPDMRRRLAELVEDEQAAEVLYQRIYETEICAANGAYTFAVIGLGSFVEGLLQAVLSEREADIRANGFTDRRGHPLQQHQIGLQVLIDIARKTGWIQLDAAEFMHKVREYRNYVHPRKQMENRVTFDRDSVIMCWAPVRAIINDLEERLGQLRTPTGQ